MPFIRCSHRCALVIDFAIFSAAAIVNVYRAYVQSGLAASIIIAVLWVVPMTILLISTVKRDSVPESVDYHLSESLLASIPFPDKIVSDDRVRCVVVRDVAELIADLHRVVKTGANPDRIALRLLRLTSKLCKVGGGVYCNLYTMVKSEINRIYSGSPVRTSDIIMLTKTVFERLSSKSGTIRIRYYCITMGKDVEATVDLPVDLISLYTVRGCPRVLYGVVTHEMLLYHLYSILRECQHEMQ